MSDEQDMSVAPELNPVPGLRIDVTARGPYSVTGDVSPLSLRFLGERTVLRLLAHRKGIRWR